MVTKVRKQIYINPSQETWLKQLARETGTTEAEIIRQAIDHHTRLFRFPRRDLAAWAEERAFIAELIQRGPTPGQRIWQREELHER
jgi:hypothetical protein